MASDPSAAGPPQATYRLQFNEHFRLADALALVPYLHELGLSHVYASPLFQARPHSLHGYDVCDFSQLNNELGTEADLERLVAALHDREMGLVLDIVPNHMGVWTPENHWWWDVLTHGPASRFAGYFDINWQAEDPELRGKVLAPVLADRLESVLERGELRIMNYPGGFFLRHFDQLLPVNPRSLAGDTLPSRLRELNGDHAALEELVRRQFYLPVCRREADSRLNYRRFFGVASLAGLRVEDEQVFRDVHSLLRAWLERGWVDGLRVDHPDGLRDPGQYLRRLSELAPDAWIVVEKILEPEETIPGSWPVAGTTGYDFLNMVNGLFVAPEGEKTLTDFYDGFTGGPADYEGLVHDKKRDVLGGLFATEVNRLSGILTQVAARHWRFKDFTWDEFRAAMSELAACFPVYRTYIQTDAGAPGKADIVWIERAEAAARCRRPDLDPKLFDLLRDLLLLRLRGELENEFVARFQQLTGPVMAKGVEDSVFYCFNRLTSLNEVGADPQRFGVDVVDFHEFCRSQQAHWPYAMLASSTHDTKRSEDVRARLDLLSEIPEAWSQAVRRWSALNERHRRHGQPDRNIEYFFYQTLVGAWPLTLERALAYIEKASCEAAEHTAWAQRDAVYDEALRAFVTSALEDPTFTSDFKRFLAPLIDAGQVNSLAQTLIKLTAPGVPDIYQGCEIWDLSLVDPDNRRPVDFELRTRLLAEIKSLTAEEIWQRRNAGLPKMWLIRRVLTLRRKRPGPFSGSSRHDALSARGAKAAHAVVFMRGGSLISVIPRLVLGLQDDWQNTTLDLPPGRWRNELGGEEVLEPSVPLRTLLRGFPVALLTRREDE